MLNISLDDKAFQQSMDKLYKQVDSWGLEALSEMADSLLLLSRAEVPHDQGRLQSSAFTRKKGQDYEVIYNTDYASYQHEGVRHDGTHKIRRYQKGRKGKYLEDPLKMNLTKWQSIARRKLASKLQGEI